MKVYILFFHFISFFEAHLTRTELDGLLLSTLTSQLPAWTLIESRVAPCFHVVYAELRPYNVNFAAEIKTHQNK